MPFLRQSISGNTKIIGRLQDVPKSIKWESNGTHLFHRVRDLCIVRITSAKIHGDMISHTSIQSSLYAMFDNYLRFLHKVSYNLTHFRIPIPIVFREFDHG